MVQHHTPQAAVTPRSARALSVSKYFKIETEDVWVINLWKITKKSDLGAELCIDCKDESGEASLVKIWDTHIPINATDQVAKKSLLASTPFRNLVMRNYLKLISPDDAEQMMKSSAFQAERERLRNEANRVVTAEMLRGDDAVKLGAAAMAAEAANREARALVRAAEREETLPEYRPEFGEEDLNGSFKPVTSEVVGPRPTVMALMMDESLSSEQLCGRLEQEADAMKTSDWAYVINNTTDTAVKDLALLHYHN